MDGESGESTEEDEVTGIVIASYGALRHVPPDFLQFISSTSLWSYIEYDGNLLCQIGAYLQDYAYHSYYN